MVLVLNRNELKECLPMEEAINAVEEGFRHYKNAKVPRRMSINLEEYQGLFLYMPAYIGGVEALAIKEVSVHRNNPIKGLPTVQGTVLLNDPKDGTLLAIMDGGTLTAIRTGATTGVATKYLARGDSKVLGIFGAGVQARTQVEAINCVRSLSMVKVYDINPQAAKSFSMDLSKALGIDVIMAENPRGVLDGADIVVTATTSKNPVFSGEWVSPGTHINGIGSHTPDSRELDSETIRKSRLIVDSRESCLEEAGDVIIPIREGEITESHIKAELGEVVTGEKEGRLTDDDVTVFKSVGLALEDATAALRAYEIALRKGIGREIWL
ncbi:MAG: ornithine cyclodeaminase family protein [Candidatus Methanomethyliales bacterium]|nr:ornithine cyclodeaminase family protein [Candidatus Methanomethylicales archaeon]